MARTPPKNTMKMPPPRKMMMPQAKGQRPIRFQPGGMHKSLGVPMGKPIPAGKKAAALAGKYGDKAKRQALLAKNVLRGKK